MDIYGTIFCISWLSVISYQLLLPLILILILILPHQAASVWPKDNPNKIKMVDFLEQKTLAGRVWKKARPQPK